ncbi:hypothetical protein [Geotalea toluenoxydans]
MKNMLKFQLAMVILLLVTSCSSNTDRSDFGQLTDGAKEVSIVSLIATPERYDGKVVRVYGVLVLEFEGDAIYITKADAENHIFKNSISLQIDYAKLGIPEKEPSDPEQRRQMVAKAKSLKSLTKKYVLIEGVFDKNTRGHLGLSSGSINVTRIAHFSEKKSRKFHQ